MFLAVVTTSMSDGDWASTSPSMLKLTPNWCEAVLTASPSSTIDSAVRHAVRTASTSVVCTLRRWAQGMG